ncbi:MAG: hypothetical protein D6736_14280 [Nitrospinota bacterium]|nr:MAG: hypothetical protein D6736_14280 [Nitrospinota bacterium]
MFPLWPEKYPHIWLLFPVLILLGGMGVSRVEANGGTPRLEAVAAGPYLLSAWTQPDPPRVGRLHVSVAVMDPSTKGVILDADVRLMVHPVGEEGRLTSIQATHGAGTNALLYHANVELSREGPWLITVQVEGEDGQGVASFSLAVEPPAALGWKKLGGGGAGILLLLLWMTWYRRRHRS